MRRTLTTNRRSEMSIYTDEEEGQNKRIQSLRLRPSCQARNKSNAPSERRRRLQTMVRQVYNEVRRVNLSSKWTHVCDLMVKNRRLLSEQLETVRITNLANSSLISDEYMDQDDCSCLAEPVEIPNLYSQFGRFEARIGPNLCRIPLTMMPQVSLFI